jgi:probable rRNA maturation factor
MIINLHTSENVTLPCPEEQLEHAARATLDACQAPTDAELTLFFGDDSLLQRLNHQFRGIDAPTDVLSFPIETNIPTVLDLEDLPNPVDRMDPEIESLYLGDVVISLERARAQATAGGHPLIDELLLLIVHGVLHLSGYDHSEPHETTQMQMIQDKILQALGCTIRPTLES